MINFEMPKCVVSGSPNPIESEAIWYTGISCATGQISGYLAELGKDGTMTGDMALAVLCEEMERALNVVDGKLTVLNAQIIHRDGFEP